MHMFRERSPDDKIKKKSLWRVKKDARRQMTAKLRKELAQQQGDEEASEVQAANQADQIVTAGAEEFSERAGQVFSKSVSIVPKVRQQKHRRQRLHRNSPPIEDGYIAERRPPTPTGDTERQIPVTANTPASAAPLTDVTVLTPPEMVEAARLTPTQPKTLCLLHQLSPLPRLLRRRVCAGGR